MKTQIVTALVKFNLGHILPRDVALHEIPVLMVLYGVDNVELVRVMADGPSVDARSEFLRLKKVYKAKSQNGENPADMAFPDGSRDLELLYAEGLESYAKRMRQDSDLGPDLETAMFNDEDGAEVPTEEIEVLDEDGEPVAPSAEVVVNERDRLKAQLREMNVEFPGNASNVALRELLAQAQLGVGG